MGGGQKHAFHREEGITKLLGEFDYEVDNALDVYVQLQDFNDSFQMLELKRCSSGEYLDKIEPMKASERIVKGLQLSDGGNQEFLRVGIVGSSYVYLNNHQQLLLGSKVRALGQHGGNDNGSEYWASEPGFVINLAAAIEMISSQEKIFNDNGKACEVKYTPNKLIKSIKQSNATKLNFVLTTVLSDAAVVTQPGKHVDKKCLGQKNSGNKSHDDKYLSVVQENKYDDQYSEFRSEYVSQLVKLGKDDNTQIELKKQPSFTYGNKIPPNFVYTERVKRDANILKNHGHFSTTP
ncbi:hypothetical protein [Cysteiniphilum sp. JM-1]|uniref:hypothetical protein n=1 Tax=Cysteiniphilum sp. JM-1 TaxID=2610891 RepID=UPI001243AA94|nr:hypothetical protein [Cysteiniphilum sp. JM-1]